MRHEVHTFPPGKHGRSKLVASAITLFQSSSVPNTESLTLHNTNSRVQKVIEAYNTQKKKAKTGAAELTVLGAQLNADELNIVREYAEALAETSAAAAQVKQEAGVKKVRYEFTHLWLALLWSNARPSPSLWWPGRLLLSRATCSALLPLLHRKSVRLLPRP